MITFYKFYQLVCDKKKDNRCWKELTVSLENNETAIHAKKFARKFGWSIYDKNKCACPYCSKGIINLQR